MVKDKNKLDKHSFVFLPRDKVVLKLRCSVHANYTTFAIFQMKLVEAA